MIKKFKQGFNAAAAAIGLSVLLACTESPPSGEALALPQGLRTLTSSEVGLAKTVFDDSIDYSHVYIKTKSFPSRSKAYNGIIRFSKQDYSADFSEASLNMRTTFIHELEHMRQEQSGTNLIRAAIGLFFRGLYNDNSAYDYGDIASIDHFSKLNIEQKAALTADFYKARERYQDFTSQTLKDSNCDFQRDSARLLRPHLPQTQISPACENQIA